MMLPDVFEMLLSTARAGCGLGLVLASVFVGRWSYANPQPTWKHLWNGMPHTLRGLITLMVLVFMTAHAVLTYREYFVGAPAPAQAAKRVAPAAAGADPLEMEKIMRGKSSREEPQQAAVTRE